MPSRTQKESGQALVEYVLIVVLVVIAFGVTLAATGPAIGNVFCNVVDNIGGVSANPQGGNCGNMQDSLFDEGGAPTLFWATVTWVAGHPQQETPFPTPVHRAATAINGGVPNTATPSASPTNSPTPTASNTSTPTNTSTPSDTPSPGPSPTQSDLAFAIPFVDQIDNPQWWRLDHGDVWTVQWYADHSYTGSNSTTTYRDITFIDQRNAMSLVGGNSLSFEWSSGRPADAGLTSDNRFAGQFQRTFFLAQSTTFTFSIRSDDQGNIYLDDETTAFLWNRSYNGTFTKSRTLTAGAHTIRIDYAEDTGGANMFFSMTPTATSGPIISAPQDNSCTWGRNTGSNDPSSILWQFDESPGTDAWTAGQTCYLELRGYVDLSGHSQPLYSYWDIWDFTSVGNVTAELQVSDYVAVAGVLDRSQLNWHTLSTRTAGTSNYNWTRSQIDLRAQVPGLSDHVTFRYVIGSSSGGTPFRWYVDDIQVLDAPADSSFTVDNAWNLNSRDQMRDFIFDADSNKTLEDNPTLPDTIDGWRWNLTSTNAHSGMSWDDSPGGNYQGHSQGGPRVHYLEFRQPIDLTTTRSPAVPATDSNGNTGYPILSFWYAYDIHPQASIRIQYTRDANDATPDTWLDVPDGGILVDYTAPSGAPRVNEQVLRTNTTMQPVSVNLTRIPNWDTQSFRLRFALVVQAGTTDFGDGWYLDDVRIERSAGSTYIGYPFFDDAEDSTFTDAVWTSLGAKWGVSSEVGGAASSAKAYSDSPGANYDPNADVSLQMKSMIDLLNDTPGNNVEPDSRPAAANPILTFYYRRDVHPNVDFVVDVWVDSIGAWSTVWDYVSSNDATFNLERAWIRGEINLAQAAQAITGKTWAAISANADTVTSDDDIRVRFRMITNSAWWTSDGVYVDNISINNAPTTVHNLWTPGSSTNGTLVDNVEFATPIGGSLTSRWYFAGDWGPITGVTNGSHSGSMALANNPVTNFAGNGASDYTSSIFEFKPIIDLTNANAANRPILYFWTRYQIASNASFRVEIAQEDTASSSQGPDKIGGWTTWTKQPLMVGEQPSNNVITNTSVVTWLRGQVDLSSFVGSRIRVRFVYDTTSWTWTGDTEGIILDDITFTFGPSQLSLPFNDTAQSTVNWITEGTWGLGKDQYVGTGANTDIFGATQWSGTYFDCDCNSTGFETLLNSQSNYAPSDPLTLTGPKIGPSNVSEINYNWGSTVLPMGTTDTAYFNGFTVRWNRQVTLMPGTYYFRSISDDGVRLLINDISGVSGTIEALGGASTAGYIINNWTDHSASLDTGILIVGGSVPITRTLSFMFYENGGDAVAELYATSTSYSFTDSPNTPNGSGFTTVNSLTPGNSSLMLNGYFNLVGSPNTPVLSYKTLYDMGTNSRLRSEYSTDGGFTWTQGDVRTGTRILSSGTDWLDVSVNLPQANNVMIRFRLDTRSTTTTADGVYIANVQVKN